VRYKPVPEPRDVEFLRAARAAVGLVPGSEADCCSRVTLETDVASRDRAREVITFLQALGLVEETDGRFRATRADDDRGTLAARFRERVYLAEETLEALAEAGSATPAGLADRLAGLPAWERARETDPEGEALERVDRLLGWAVALGLAEREDGRYRTA
jgi:hypothetical protein